MALFDTPKLKGIEDLNDPRYSMANICRSENIKEWYKTKDGKEHIIKSTKAMVEAGNVWRELNPDKVKENAYKGYLASNLNEEATKWRNNNPERFEEIRKSAVQSFLNSEYFHSEEHIECLKRAGKASSRINIEKGNIGKDSKMSSYKIAKKAKERAKLLLQLPEEFLGSDAKKIFTTKQWYRIMKTDLVIKTNKKGGYNNTNYYWKLNIDAIEYALQQSDNPDDYFN